MSGFQCGESQADRQSITQCSSKSLKIEFIRKMLMFPRQLLCLMQHSNPKLIPQVLGGLSLPVYSIFLITFYV